MVPEVTTYNDFVAEVSILALLSWTYYLMQFNLYHKTNVKILTKNVCEEHNILFKIATRGLILRFFIK